MRLRTLTAIAAPGVALLLIACGSGPSNKNAGTADNGTATTAAPKTAKLGQKARDGKFEFVVSKVECGKTRVGSADFGAKAQGQFCLIKMTVKNIGTEAQTFDGSEQKALDAKGTQYDHDTSAADYVNKDTSTFLENINPGNSVTGTLVYDVPKGAKITAVELHDSFLSDGVLVNVS